MTLLFLYSKKRKLKPFILRHKEHAKTFLGQFDEDKKKFQEFWLYVYTVLNENELSGHNEWSEIKKKNISFVLPEYM